jgi:hypothetical protein
MMALCLCWECTVMSGAMAEVVGTVMDVRVSMSKTFSDALMGRQQRAGFET